MTDSATAYARSVIDGDVPACKWVRLACERHARDRLSGKWHWDVAAPEEAIPFLRLVGHYKGAYAGRQVEPLPYLAGERTRFELALDFDEEIVTGLVEARVGARKAKDFAEADRLRVEIEALGIMRVRSKRGTRA